MNAHPYTMAQLIKAVICALDSALNIASHEENKHVSNQLAAKNLRSCINTLTSIDVTEPTEAYKKAESARFELINVYIYEDDTLDSGLASTLNQSLSSQANMLSMVANRLYMARDKDQ